MLRFFLKIFLCVIKYVLRILSLDITPFLSLQLLTALLTEFFWSNIFNCNKDTTIVIICVNGYFSTSLKWNNTLSLWVSRGMELYRKIPV